MAFGKPAILDPKFDLRAIQDTIRSVRQRLEQIETAVTNLQNTATGTQSVTTLQAQVASLLSLFSNVQDPNEVFAGPASGTTAAQAQFRALVWADLPLVSDLSFTSGIESDALIAVEIDGAMYYMTLGDLAAGTYHNFTGGLQGGAANEFYHLDFIDFTALSGARITKGSDTTDDVIIDLATKGLVLKDTQGTPHYWRVTVSTLGALTTTDLGTTKP